MPEPLRAGDRLAPAQSRRGGGLPPAPRQTASQVRRRSPLRWLRRAVAVSAALLLGAAVLAGAAGFLAYQRFAADLPDVDGLRHYQPRVMSRLYSGDSRLMAELATERRIFVPVAAIPDIVKQAFVSAEDQHFWVHRGVDPLAIMRAALTNLGQMGQGKRPIGASTLTQQVAKNILIGNELTLARKVREALLAIRIEQNLSKERILELYLNEIYLGLSAYGVAAAGQAYFNKSLDELTLPEAAFLAALPKAPNNYNPFRFPEAARARRDWVIDRMAEDHAIGAEQAAAAKAQPIVPSPYRRLETVAGSDWFSEEVRRQLVDRFGADATTQGGLDVHTSLDPALQAVAETSLREGLMAYDRAKGGWRGPVTHLETGPALRRDWASQLAQVARPPGMLDGWTLAVVLELTDAEARLGWLSANPKDPQAPPQPRVSSLLLADLAWARPIKDGKPGAPPRRMADVAQPGDVLMVEPAAAAGAAGKDTRSDRLVLRQIPLVEGAFVCLEPATGRVLAMVGGWSFEMSQFNRATQAQRQPGSSFKPFVYLAAMQHNIPPNARFLDAPFIVDLGAAGRWRPNNYGMDFIGPVPLRIALEKSLNLVTVRVAKEVGMDAVAENAIGFHVVEQMPHVLPAALGAVDTTVMRMAGGYSGLAAGGREVVPTLIDSVQDRDGVVVWRPPGLSCERCDDTATPPSIVDQRKQVADPASVFQIVTMMQGVVARGTGAKAGAGLNRPIAGKTGTTQDFNDAWFVGFTPDLAAAVWIGFDTPTGLGDKETGGAIAAPVWHDFMAVALKNRPVLSFPVPPGVSLIKWDTGFGSVTDAFKQGLEPGAVAVNQWMGGGGGGAPSGGSTGAAGGSGLDTTVGGLY